MTAEKKTLGQAIDEIIVALSGLDEKARSTAIAAACAHLGLDRPGMQQVTSVAPSPTVHSAGGDRVSLRTLDIRSLREQKQPETAAEMACLTAYYLQEHAPPAERKDAITTDDLKKYFKHAHFPLPKRMEQLLVNARHAGYFDLVERGTYRLNAVGYNLAAHTLPKKTGV